MTKKQMRRRSGGKPEALMAGALPPDTPTLSRPLDVHRWSDYPELNGCLSELVTEIERYENRARVRSRGIANRFRDAVRSIILDLYVAWSTDPGYEVGVSLGKTKFSHKTRYDALFLTYDAFHPAYTGLVELGYVQVTHRHFHDPRTGIGRVTRIRATPKLIELLTKTADLNIAKVSYRSDQYAEEVIVLREAERDGVKAEIEYKDTKSTAQMRSQVERINAALACHWLDLYLPDKMMADLNARMANDFKRGEREVPHVDVTAKRLRRIFNNSDWRQGGRFYGGWWQNIPKEHRRYITINDKFTVEIDYSVMHPALMYAEVGAKLDGDAYDIGAQHVNRDLIKRTFNQLVNAEGRTDPKSDFNEDECRMSWTELQQQIKARHKPIAQFLGTGKGLYLQNKDAQIANQIMLRFLDMNYVCLPVHDSFIVHHGLKDELTTIMGDEFRKLAATNIGTKPKWDIISGSNVLEPVAVHNFIAMDDPFSNTEEYAGYETRLNNWWATKG